MIDTSKILLRASNPWRDLTARAGTLARFYSSHGTREFRTPTLWIVRRNYKAPSRVLQWFVAEFVLWNGSKGENKCSRPWNSCHTRPLLRLINSRKVRRRRPKLAGLFEIRLLHLLFSVDALYVKKCDFSVEEVSDSMTRSVWKFDM